MFVCIFLAVPLISAAETEKPPTTITRTEIKVSRSLNPEDTQTLNVMTRDGGVAQLIVKRRDPKSKQSPLQNLQSNHLNADATSHSNYPRSIYTNWIPVSSVYIQPNLIRLDTVALLKNATKENVPLNNNLGNIIDSDR